MSGLNISGRAGSPISRRSLLVAAAAMPLLSACTSSSKAGSSGSGKAVTITVQGLPPAAQATSRAAFMRQVADFEKKHPDIQVKPSDTQWDAQTFATRLASGQAETVILVPFTEPPNLIAKGYVADIGQAAAKLARFGELDKRGLAPLRVDGKLYGLPYVMYALGLAYRRDLFKRAGLDPNNPPTTWDEVRAAAKQIADKTGVPGFAEMTTNNTGGWHLTAATYTFGGRMERKEGDKYVAAFDDAPLRDYLTLLQKMRFADNSMGTNQLRNWDDAHKDFATGKIAMFVDAPDGYNVYSATYHGSPDAFGMAPMPQGGGNATLMGGTAMMVNAKASAAQIDAAVKWMDFFGLRPAYDPTLAASNAKTAAADKAPVGIPSAPLFTQDIQNAINEAIKPYVNVPQANFASYVSGVAKLDYVPEPPVAAQDIYKQLDNLMQQVLTQSGTDVAQAVKKNAEGVNALLSRTQQ